MQPLEYITMRRVEDRHWWYAVLRRQVIEAMTVRLKPDAQVLDAGCGTGGMMECLRPLPWSVQGIDLDPRAVLACQQRGLTEVQQADVSRLPFLSDQFDAVLSLDVLYHQSVNQEVALMEMVRVLKPGGWLILNLPAFECLRGSHDAAVCGARRYKACHVRHLLGLHSMGAEIFHPWNASLFIPIFLHRVWSRLRGQKWVSDLNLPPKWLNAWLTHLGHLDAKICRWTHFPIGTSWFVVARKR